MAKITFEAQVERNRKLILEKQHWEEKKSFVKKQVYEHLKLDNKI